MRRFGYMPGERLLCLGDMGSDSSSRSENRTDNNQVGLQGTGQVGISNSSLVNSGIDVTYYSADADAVRNANEITHASLEAMATTSLGAAKLVQSAQDRSATLAERALASQATVAERGLELSKHGMDLSRSVSNAAYETVIHTLDALQTTQERSLISVDRAVQGAQQVALLATPQSPAAYSEILGAQSGSNQRQLLMAAAFGLALIFFVRRK